MTNVTVHDSAITVSGAPRHLVLRVHNPTARPVTLRVVSAEYLPPSGLPVALARFAASFASAPGSVPYRLGPGVDAEGELFFEYAARAIAGTRESYRFVVRFRFDGRETVARARAWFG